VSRSPGAPCPTCGAVTAAGHGPTAPGAGGDFGAGQAATGAPFTPPQSAPPPRPDAAVGLVSDSKARDLVLVAHLSALVGLVGIPSPLGPLVLWLAKREAHPFVDAQAKEALNFNLSALLYTVAIFVIGFVFTLVTLGLGIVVFIPVVLAAMIAWVVLVVVAAVKASKGELFRYPLTIRFVR
jgi:uncharacterized Tic20 family protein